jgi:programmed cell death protein 4
VLLLQDLLLELNIGPNHYQVIKIAINMAMDRHNTHRELTSRLISDLHSSLFHQDDVAKCFNSLLSGIDDLMLDAPDAPNVS